MGLFDSFVQKKKIKCPDCGNDLSGEFQTKQFASAMKTFSLGEEVSYFNMVVKNGKYKVYDYCDKCRKTIYAWVTIQKGIFTKVELED